jgi:hypothetical protein
MRKGSWAAYVLEVVLVHGLGRRTVGFVKSVRFCPLLLGVQGQMLNLAVYAQIREICPVLSGFLRFWAPSTPGEALYRADRFR